MHATPRPSTSWYHNGITKGRDPSANAIGASHAKQRCFRATLSSRTSPVGSARNPHSWHCHAGAFAWKSGSQGRSVKLPKCCWNCATRRWKGQHIGAISPGSTHNCITCTRAISTPRLDVGANKLAPFFSDGCTSAAGGRGCSSPRLPENSLLLSLREELGECCSWIGSGVLFRWLPYNTQASPNYEDDFGRSMDIRCGPARVGLRKIMML